jgi:hypothetical protein
MPEKKEFGPYRGRYYNELISEYKTLKNTIEEYAKRGEPLPITLKVQLPKLNALQKSFKRLNIKV